MANRLPWARIVLEGGVIVVSILLAFGIDAWWDRRQAAGRFQATLGSLEVAFLENVEGIDEQLEVSDEFRRHLETFFELSPDEARGLPADVAHQVLTSVHRQVTASLNNEYLAEVVAAADLSSQPDLEAHIARWRREAFLLRERRAVLVDLEQVMLRASGHHPEMGPHLRGHEGPHPDAAALALLRADPEVVALANTKALSWAHYRGYFVGMKAESESVLEIIRTLRAQ